MDAISKKMERIAQKKAALEQQLKELEIQKQSKNITAEDEDVKDLISLIEDLANKRKVSAKKIATIIKDNVSGRVSNTKERTFKPAVVKYRDTAPGCENNTWSGRGLMPLWLKRYESVGRSKNEFLV